MQYTVGQIKAIAAIWALVSDPAQHFLIISGPAGTGKSEIVKSIVKDFDAKTRALTKLTGLAMPSFIQVTATSNKAVDALAEKGIEARTIHSFLGLKPLNGKLVSSGMKPKADTLIIIDECSFIDDELAEYISAHTGKGSKVVFIGDPYQLPPIKHDSSPLFDEGIKEIELTEIMRQDKDNPIQKLSMELREFVQTGIIPKLTTDDKHIFHIQDEDTFIDLMLESFKIGKVTKLVSFSNAVVHNANAIAKEELEGAYEIKKGDILVCNKYVNHPIRQIKTDSTVIVSDVKSATSLGHKGKRVFLTTGIHVFVPDNPKLFKDISQEKWDYTDVNEYNRQWADLRPGYACTIHKSQGSTYQNVFINLNELNTLDDNHLARLLYVAVSRASEKVYFMGDL